MILPQHDRGRHPMSLTVRRVVTGHDENGRAIVSIDETFKNVVQTRPGAHAAGVWTSEGFLVDNDGRADTSGRKIGIATIDNGTVFPGDELRPRGYPAQPPYRYDRLRYGDLRRDRHGARRHQRAPQGWRRAGAAGHDP